MPSMKLLLVLLVCAACSVSGLNRHHAWLSHKPTTSMGKAFAKIDNNLIGLINCAAQRIHISPQKASFIEEEPCASSDSSTSSPVLSSSSSSVSVSAGTVIPLPIEKSSKPCSSSTSSSLSSTGQAVPDMTSKELANYFTSLHGDKAIKGDGIMKLCRHAGGPFAGVFGKIRKAATGLAASVEKLMPLFRTVDHDEVVVDATSEAAAESPAVVAAPAASDAPVATAPAEAAASSFVDVASDATPAPSAPSTAPSSPSSSTPAAPANSAPAPAPAVAAPAATAPSTPLVAPIVLTAPSTTVSPVIDTTTVKRSSRKVRFDSQHKPTAEVVCDFLVRHVDDLDTVCPGAASDADGEKIISGLIGQALSVALKGKSSHSH